MAEGTPNPGLSASSPAPGSLIETACGGTTYYSLSTPRAIYNGKPVYFCMAGCKLQFERNPLASCLALTIDRYEQD